MFKNVLIGLLALSVAGCSFKVHRSEIRTTPESENNQVIEKRITFLRMVEFIRVNHSAPPSETMKLEFNSMISLSGMRYACNTDNKCYLYKDNMKIQIFPEFVYIEYPDKSYRKIYDPTDAVKIIYS